MTNPNSTTTLSNEIRDLLDTGNSGADIARMLTEILNTEEKAYKERLQEKADTKAKYEAVEYLYEDIISLCELYGIILDYPTDKEIEETFQELDNLFGIISNIKENVDILKKNAKPSSTAATTTSTNTATSSATTSHADDIIQDFLRKVINKRS